MKRVRPGMSFLEKFREEIYWKRVVYKRRWKLWNKLFVRWVHFYKSFVTFLDRTCMTFVRLALSKDTTHLYTAGCRETIWKKRLCLRKRRLQIKTKSCLPPHNLNYHPFIFILSRLSSKKGRTESRQNIVANNLCQFLPFTYTRTRRGKTGLKQINTNETLVTSFKVAIF